MIDRNPEIPVSYSISYLGTFCLLIGFLSSCGPKSSNPNVEPEFDEHDAAAVQDAVLKSLRTSQVTDKIYSTGAVFNLALLNDVDRTAHYTKRDNKGAAAANFGIYLSDLKYLIAYDQHDEVRQYFEACLRLSEYAGIKKQFVQAVQFRFDEIITGDEGFEKSVQQQIKDADNTSKGEEYKKAHASALAGYYIEELYHLVSFLQSYKPDSSTDKVFFTILELSVTQKDELNSLIGYFDHIKMKPEGISAYQELLSIQTMYLGLDNEELLREPDPSQVLQNRNLRELFDAILYIRNKIVDF